MRKLKVTFLLCGLITMVSCSGSKPKSDNPLINATEEQFMHSMGLVRKFHQPPCFEMLYRPELKSYYGSWTLKDCEAYVQKKAKKVGIEQPITLKHLQDPQVKQRYLKLDE